MLYSYLLWFAPLWSFHPLLGKLLLILQLCLKLMSGAKGGISLYATGLPSLFAGLSWRFAFMRSPLFLSLVASLSFLLFGMQVGFNSHLLFASYWFLLPLFGFFGFAHTLGGQALIASLYAHVAGTLIVLCGGLAVDWHALAAHVGFERLIAAAGMMITVVLVQLAQRLIAAFVGARRSSHS